MGMHLRQSRAAFQTAVLSSCSDSWSPIRGYLTEKLRYCILSLEYLWLYQQLCLLPLASGSTTADLLWHGTGCRDKQRLQSAALASELNTQDYPVLCTLLGNPLNTLVSWILQNTVPEQHRILAHAWGIHPVSNFNRLAPGLFCDSSNIHPSGFHLPRTIRRFIDLRWCHGPGLQPWCPKKPFQQPWPAGRCVP